MYCALEELVLAGGMVVVVLTEEGEQGPSSQREDRMRQMLARSF